MRGGVPGGNARSSAHSTGRAHDYGWSRGAVSDRRHSWWPEGFDPARSGSRRGQDPTGEETGSDPAKDAHHHVENAARGICRMRFRHWVGSPVWTRFELSRPKMWSARTLQTALAQWHPSQAGGPIRTGHPHDTILEPPRPSIDEPTFQDLGSRQQGGSFAHAAHGCSASPPNPECQIGVVVGERFETPIPDRFPVWTRLEPLRANLAVLMKHSK